MDDLGLTDSAGHIFKDRAPTRNSFSHDGETFSAPSIEFTRSTFGNCLEVYTSHANELLAEL
jgi:hypothetical protein